MRAMKGYKVLEKKAQREIVGGSEEWKTDCTDRGLGNTSMLAGGPMR